MKKAQIEIVGLLIIVLLISLMLLFVVKVVFTKENKNHLTTYQDNVLASSFTGTLLRTTAIGCSTYDIEDVLIAIGKNTNYKCPQDDSLLAMDYINDTIKIYLENTLGEWNYPYHFQIYNGNTLYTNITSVLPLDPSGGKADTYYLPLNPGTLEIWLCLRAECYRP